MLVTATEGPGRAAVALRPAVSQTLAFEHATVVPMDRERVLHDQTVLVVDGRIAAVASSAEVAVPSGAERIDGRGKFMMPGLADMHVHLWDQRTLMLFVANGVTTVRNMWGAPRHLTWRREIASGERLGPTIYTTGPLIDGTPPIWNTSVVVETPEEAERVVADQKRAGYDFVKVYSMLSREAYAALFAAAGRHGIKVVGHVPAAAGLDAALDAKQASIEHLTGYFEATQTASSPLIGASDRRLLRQLPAYVDEGRFSTVATATARAGVWNSVTLVVAQKFVPSTEAATLLARPEMRFVPPRLRAGWDPTKDFRMRDRTARDWELQRRGDTLRNALVSSLHRAHARILLGTDTPNPFVAPGFSIHEELRNLVAAGLTPYEAIRAGTRDAAEFLDGLADFGTVEPGRRADLLLVDGNPLDDVANVARLAGVMIRGRWLPAAELQRMLNELADSYSRRTASFAAMPAFPGDGAEFYAEYDASFEGIPDGAERVVLKKLPDGRRLLAAQAISEPLNEATVSLRLVLDTTGRVETLQLNRNWPDGQATLDISKGDPRLQPGVIGSPMVATQLLLSERLKGLTVGGHLRLQRSDLELGNAVNLLDATVDVERAPDATADVAGRSVPVRVYTLDTRRNNASFRSTLRLDGSGWPASFETEQQSGNLTYRRVR
ncbi:MAG: amidohydrolase family protein [Acidobacteria bacterium]|nr:amidohydrolase family protein [Acidobacteriota bacterium]MCA1652058.1 amidohydrolase family protein [Acidobacteriota bacterium]